MSPHIPRRKDWMVPVPKPKRPTVGTKFRRVRETLSLPPVGMAQAWLRKGTGGAGRDPLREVEGLDQRTP